MTFGEDLNTAWRRRYGIDAPEGIPGGVAPFLRHRSVRRFSDQAVSEEVLAGLIGAAQSAATSSNLQLWSVVSVREPSTKADLALLCGDQSQVRDCPVFLAWLCDHHRLAQEVAAIGEDPNCLDYADYFLMGVIDAALAAERFLVSAESLGLGGCYIGALRNSPQGVADLLGLPEQVFGVFGMTLGYAADNKDAIKPRQSQNVSWHRERYSSAGIGDYNDRMREFYAETGQSTDFTWSQRSGRRLGEKYMSGRQVLRAWLESRGLSRR